MTPERVNQARFLLGWSVEQLARASRVSAPQLATFEAGGWIHPLQLASVRKALASQGVEFREGRCALKQRTPDLLTAEQCRAGRQFLGWSQRRLAAECGVPAAVITVFEKSGAMSPPRGDGHTGRPEALRAALEAAGVEFKNGDAPGVRLRRAEP